MGPKDPKGQLALSDLLVTLEVKDFKDPKESSEEPVNKENLVLLDHKDLQDPLVQLEIEDHEDPLDPLELRDPLENKEPKDKED